MTATLKTLRAEAAALNISNYRKMDRESLSNAIVHHQEVLDAQAAREALRTARDNAREVERERAKARRQDQIVTPADEDFYRIVRYAQNDIAAFEVQSQRFQENFAQNPAYALSWSKDLFEATATRDVAQSTINHWEEGTSFEDFTRVMTNVAMTKARYVPSSTSATSNLIDQFTIAAYAKLVERCHCGF